MFRSTPKRFGLSLTPSPHMRDATTIGRFYYLYTSFL